jgi:single-stranded DNA-binding protein
MFNVNFAGNVVRHFAHTANNGATKHTFVCRSRNCFKTKGADGKLGYNSTFANIVVWAQPSKSGKPGIWERIAEADYKGLLQVEGHLTNDNYTDGSGNKHYDLVISPTNVNVLEPAKLFGDASDEDVAEAEASDEGVQTALEIDEETGDISIPA